jgi:hypothetical protein
MLNSVVEKVLGTLQVPALENALQEYTVVLLSLRQ